MPAVTNVASAHPSSPYNTRITNAGMSSIRSSVIWFAMVSVVIATSSHPAHLFR
jgi:hypothetical protein